MTMEATSNESKVQRLVSLTRCDESVARFLLEASGWNEQVATTMFYDQQPNTGLRPPPHIPELPPRPLAPASVRRGGEDSAAQAPAQQAARGGLVPLLIGTAFRLPIFLIRTTFGLMAGSIALGLGMASLVGDRVLPQPVMRSIRGAAASLSGRTDLLPQAQAELFIQQFKDAYGDRHPTWQPAELQVACIAARSQHRFLLAYLHSPEHENTEAFCQHVLCDPDLVAYANQQFVCWGGDVRQSDAHALSLRLGATTYPFIAVLSLTANNKATLVQASQGVGLLVPGALLRLLHNCMEAQGAILVAQRAEMQERETTRQLLAQQNEEYEASLAADRQREQQRQEEQRQQEQAAREQAEAEAKERAAKEDAERRKRERLDAITARRAAQRSSLQPEPAAGAQGSALVRVRLPDGSNAQRSFGAGSCVADLFTFVDSLDATNAWKYNLVSNYPRKVFTQEASSMKATLLEAGLVPHAALFVQPLDDDEEASIV